MGERVYREASHTAERVGAEIRRAIRRGELLPGEHVRQGAWASQVGVSSASTREALKMLGSEQLLTYDAHRGYLVARIDPFEMAQIYQIRRILQTEVLRSIRWPDADELKAIGTAMDAVVDGVRRADGHGALETVRVVSFSIFDLSPLHLVVAETKRVWDRAATYRSPDLATLEDPHGIQIADSYA